MAKVRLNQLLDAIRGGIGGLIFRRRPDGTIIVSGVPHFGRRRKYSPKQKAHQERFRQAAQYARWAARHYPIYAELAAGDPNWKSPYNFALSDWFEAPVIHAIERGDGCIRVRASDNIQVARVRVSVLDEAGTVLETGEAVRCGEEWWQLNTHVTGATLHAEAEDLARHATRLVV